MSAGVIASSLRLGRARSLKLKQEEVVPPNVKLGRSQSVGILNCVFPILLYNKCSFKIPVRKDGIRNYPLLPVKEEDSQLQVSGIVNVYCLLLPVLKNQNHGDGVHMFYFHTSRVKKHCPMLRRLEA